MNRHSGFGFSTILLTFVMICMATFCALALMTAQSDYRLSKKVADNSDAYCTAERNAFMTLATIDAAFMSLRATRKAIMLWLQTKSPSCAAVPMRLRKIGIW